MRKAKPAADLTRTDDPMSAQQFECMCGKSSYWPPNSINRGCIDHGLSFDKREDESGGVRAQSDMCSNLKPISPQDTVDDRKIRVINSACQTHEMIIDEITTQLVADPSCPRYSIGLSTFPADVVGLVLERMTLDGWEVHLNHEGYLMITLPVVPVLSPLPGEKHQSVVSPL